MRLVYRYNSFEAEASGGVERNFISVRMMGVIVGDDRSVHFTIVFEPSSNSVEFFKTRGYFVGRYSVDSGGGESRDGVYYVVFAGDG